LKILILSNRDILSKSYIYGEDYYIRTLMELLRKMDNNVDLAVLYRDKIRVYRGENLLSVESIDDLIKDYNLVVLHNVSPYEIIRARIKYNIKVIMSIYLLWNRASPLIYNLLSRIGVTLWQFIVDGYIASSPLIYRKLRLQGVFKKIYVIPPYYKCPYCSFEENIKKRYMLGKKSPAYVKVVYIGSVNLRRLPLIEVVKKFMEDQRRNYEITIYTADNVGEKVYKIKNVEIKIINKILSEEEKCKILWESHMFIAPRQGTTMIPSISVMEAEYHGNIIIRCNDNINLN